MYRNYFILVLMLFPLWGTAQINLSAKNYSGDVILARYVQGKTYAVDTLKGAGNYSYKQKLDKGIYLFLLGQKYFEFPVGSDQSFTLSVDNSKELSPTLQVSGSSDNIRFQEFLKLKDQEQRESFIEQKLAAIKDPFFSAYLKALNPVSCNLKNDTAAFYYSRNHYWDNTDLTLPTLLNSPLITGKMDYYFNKMFVQNPDTIIPAIASFMNLPMSDEVRQAALSFLLPFTFENKTMGMEKSFVWLAENFFIGKELTWLDEKLKKNITEQYLLNKYCLVGERGHNLSLTRADGTPFDLYQQSGDYTLLLFFDISCSSCKKMVHELSENFKELFLKGVDVVALNTEMEEEKWKAYIHENSISDWTNVMDIHGESNYHTLYGIRVTPTIYLFDKDLTIIGKKLTVDQVLTLINQSQNRNQL